MPKNYDIILMGATSFVGAITAKRFAELLDAGGTDKHIALAARSKSKLDDLVNDLTANSQKLSSTV
jgi:short subunit dehydrogenase-like uncharacterized protein